MNQSGSRTITVGNHTVTPTTVALSGSSDYAYLYQGFSESYLNTLYWPASKTADCASLKDRCVMSFIHRTGDVYGQSGYKVISNQAVTGTASGTSSQYPGGWADESDASGNGVEIGVNQLAAYWPKSLEFRDEGNTVQVGIW